MSYKTKLTTKETWLYLQPLWKWATMPYLWKHLSMKWGFGLWSKGENGGEG